jgi:hypothetical protein
MGGAIRMQVAFMRIKAQIKTREHTYYAKVFLQKQRDNNGTRQKIQSRAKSIFFIYFRKYRNIFGDVQTVIRLNSKLRLSSHLQL